MMKYHGTPPSPLEQLESQLKYLELLEAKVKNLSPTASFTEVLHLTLVAQECKSEISKLQTLIGS